MGAGVASGQLMSRDAKLRPLMLRPRPLAKVKLRPLAKVRLFAGIGGTLCEVIYFARTATENPLDKSSYARSPWQAIVEEMRAPLTTS